MQRTSAVGALILVLEDDSANQLLAQTVLEDAGYRVRCAETVADGRHLVAAERPALILADIQLRDASGLDFAREISGDPRTASIPVVCLTAHAMPGLEVVAAEAGCADYLTKPIDILELVRRVHANLELARRASGGAAGPAA